MTLKFWHWEDAESTKDRILRLSKDFAWAVHPECDVALATVYKDREIYGDHYYHWDVANPDDLYGAPIAEGIASSMKEAREAAETILAAKATP